MSWGMKVCSNSEPEAYQRHERRDRVYNENGR